MEFISSVAGDFMPKTIQCPLHKIIYNAHHYHHDAKINTASRWLTDSIILNMQWYKYLSYQS